MPSVSEINLEFFAQALHILIFRYWLIAVEYQTTS